MTIVPIKKPGATVRQQIATRTIASFNPAMPACVVAPCYSILEATEASGAINSDALMSLPATLLGTVGASAFAVGQYYIRIKVNGADDLEKQISGVSSASSIPIDTLISRLNELFATYLVFTKVTGNYIRVSTIITGDSASIQFLTPAGADEAHTRLGFITYNNVLATGVSSYTNRVIEGNLSDLPAPTVDMDDMVLDPDDVEMFIQNAGAVTELSRTEAINVNSTSHLPVVTNTGNGGSFSALTVSQKGPVVYFASSRVDDLASATFSSVASTQVASSGYEPSVGQYVTTYLYPKPTSGSKTDRFVALGRHAYLDLQLNLDTDKADDYYHFEAHGFQPWIASPSTVPFNADNWGPAPGALGNSVYLQFSNATEGADGSITGVGLNEFNSNVKNRNFVAGDVGKYIVCTTGTNIGLRYKIDTLVGITKVTTTSAMIADANPIGYYIADGDYTLPHVKDAANDGGKAKIEVEYSALHHNISAFITEMEESASAQKWFAADQEVSYPGPGIDDTHTMSPGLDISLLGTNKYYLSYGANPVNLGTTNGTYAYPVIVGEARMEGTGYFNALKSSGNLTIRINGGPEREVVWTTGNADTVDHIVSAINTAAGSTIATKVASDTLYGGSLGMEHKRGTGYIETSGGDTILTDASTDFSRLDLGADGTGFKVWLYGSSIPGGTRGVLTTIKNAGVSAGSLTLSTVDLVAGSTACSYMILRSPSATTDILSLTLSDTVPIAAGGSPAGVDASIELGGSSVDVLFKGPYSGSESVYSGIFRGSPLPTVVGDALYNAGTLQGTITALESLPITGDTILTGTFTNAIIKVNGTVGTVGTPLTAWYVKARAISEDETGAYDSGVGRPNAELYVDETTSQFRVKAGLARGIDGVEFNSASSLLLAAYKALRLDVTAQASNPAPLLITGADDVTTQIGSDSMDNPLSIMCSMVIPNAPNIRFYALGIDEVSETMPEGTMAAWRRAFTLLESSDVYAIAVATPVRAVHDLLFAHVTGMSDEDAKRERIGIVCMEQPVEYSPTLVGSASGIEASLNVPAGTFDLEIPMSDFNIAAALAGKTNSEGDPVPMLGAVDIEDGLYIERSGDPFRYSVSEILTGNILRCRTTGFADGYGPGTSGNDDAFYSEDLPGSGECEAWDVDGEIISLYIRQDAIDTTTSTGKAAAAQALAELGQRYADRRMIFVQPDVVNYNLNGTLVALPGYYATAAVAGMITYAAPQQPLTNAIVYGVESVTNAADKFSPENMDLAAGGGVFWLMQDKPTSAVYVRHQLTTDTSSIETQESTTTRVLDYTAKRLRLITEPLSGKYNVDSNFIAMLVLAVESFCTLMSGGIWNTLTVESITPAADGIDIAMSGIIYYPANRLRFTITV